jgi:hypothetical protein
MNKNNNLQLSYITEIYCVYQDILNIIKNDVSKNGPSSLSRKLLTSFDQSKNANDLEICNESLDYIQKKIEYSVESISERFKNALANFKSIFTKWTTDVKDLLRRIENNSDISDSYLKVLKIEGYRKTDVLKCTEKLHNEFKLSLPIFHEYATLKPTRKTFFSDTHEVQEKLDALNKKINVRLTELKDIKTPVESTNTVVSLGYTKHDLISISEKLIQFVSKDIDALWYDRQYLGIEKPIDYFIAPLLTYYLRLRRIEEQYLSLFLETGIDLIRQWKRFLKRILAKS